MKAVFQEYAGVIVAVVVLSAVILILHTITDQNGNQGILAILGEASESGEKITKLTDLEAIKRYSARKKPNVFFCREDSAGEWQEIRAGEEICLYDFLKGEDCDEQEISYRVLRIEDTAGEEMTESFEPATGKIIFPKKGSYCLYIHLIDEENVEVVRKIEIPVDAPT